MIPSLALAKGPLLWARGRAGARGGACVPRSRLHVCVLHTHGLVRLAHALVFVCCMHASVCLRALCACHITQTIMCPTRTGCVCRTHVCVSHRTPRA